MWIKRHNLRKSLEEREIAIILFAYRMQNS